MASGPITSWQRDGETVGTVTEFIFLGPKITADGDCSHKIKRIDGFELWCWRRLLRVPWIARRSNHSILKEISPEYSLEELILKLQYFGHLMQRTDSLEKTLMLGKIDGRRRSGQQRMRWLDGIMTQWTWVWASSGIWWWTGKPGICCSPWGHKELDTTEWLNNSREVEGSTDSSGS